MDKSQIFISKQTNHIWRGIIIAGSYFCTLPDRLKKGGHESNLKDVQRNVREQRTYKVEEIAEILNIGRTSATIL